MTDPNTILLPVTGYLPDYGPFTTAPAGALMDAKNIQLRVPGVIEPRGSFQIHTEPDMISGNYAYAFGAFSDALGDNCWRVVSDGVSCLLRRVSLNGGYSYGTVNGSPGANPTKFTQGSVFSALAMSQTYFTSDQGVYVISDPTTYTARTAGMPRPPTIVTTASTATPAWLPSGYITGYRAVYVKNPTTYPVYSPPSALCVAGSAVPATTNSVSVYVWLDTTCLEVGDQVQIYRSVLSSAGIPSGTIQGSPSDEMQLRYTVTLTSTDLSNKYVTFSDHMADNTWGGPALYTNDTQEGMAQASWRPGKAQDIACYNGMMFYGGMYSRQRLVLNLKSMNSQNSTGYYGETLGSWQMAGTTTAGSNVVSGVLAANITNGMVAVGQRVSVVSGAIGGWPGGYTTITSVGATSFTTAANATLSGAGNVKTQDWIALNEGGADQYIYATNSGTGTGVAANQFCTIYTDVNAPQGAYLETAYNTYYPSSGVTLYADSTNSVDHALGIQLFFESKTIDGGSFTVKSNKPLAFDKYVDSTTGVTSSRDYYNSSSNGSAFLFYSKEQQPEAVPLVNFMIVGDEKQPILRVISTKSCLWVFKPDGLWRVTGDDPSSLRLEQFDPTLQLYWEYNGSKAMSCLVERFDNDVFAWTTRGIFRISDSGAIQIDGGLRQTLLHDGYGNFDDVTYCYSTHSQIDRWVMFCPRWDTDPTKSKMFVYWPDTNNWTYWTPPGLGAFHFNLMTTAGGVLRTSGALYNFFAGGYGPIFYEWNPTKVGPTSTISDQLCADHGSGYTTVTLSSVSGTQGVSDQGPSGAVPVTIGDAILQGGQLYYVTNDASPFTVDRAGLVNGLCTWFSAFPVRVQWSATPGAGLGNQTYFEKMTFAFDQVRGGESFTYEAQGYQNQTLAQTPKPYSTRASDNTVNTPDGTYGVPDGIPLVDQISIPSDGPRVDWGIRAGFTTTQAGQYFKINGCAIHWSPVNTQITR